MPAQELARQWFIPGDGIDRHVISTDIQRYLGNDATVRPGRDKVSRRRMPRFVICLLISPTGYRRVLDQGLSQPHLCRQQPCMTVVGKHTDRRRP